MSHNWLLCRHLLEQEGNQEVATSRFYKYQEGLAKLREMAEILINKRLICWSSADQPEAHMWEQVKSQHSWDMAKTSQSTNETGVCGFLKSCCLLCILYLNVMLHCGQKFKIRQKHGQFSLGAQLNAKLWLLTHLEATTNRAWTFKTSLQNLNMGLNNCAHFKTSIVNWAIWTTMNLKCQYL